MCKESDPCYGCTKRVATKEYNCHSHCPEYLALKAEKATKAMVIKTNKGNEALFMNTRIRQMRKSTNKKHGQSAWKG